MSLAPGNRFRPARAAVTADELERDSQDRALHGQRWADGYVVLAVGNDAQFARLCAVISRSALAADERFATSPARVEHRDILVPALEETFRDRPMLPDRLRAFGRKACIESVTPHHL